MTTDDLIKYNIKNTDDYEERIYVKVEKLENNTNAVNEVADKYDVPKDKYVCFIATTEMDKNGNPIEQKTQGRYWLNSTVRYGKNYNKDKVAEESKNTRIGLQQLLDDKKAEGYNRVKLLKGQYRIDHELQIYIPSDFTLDMNGAVLKLNQFTGSKCLMVDVNDTFNSHLINGMIEGDYYAHDYSDSPNNSEWVCGVAINGSKYSSIEDLIIRDVTGYGACCGNGISRDGKYYTYNSTKNIGKFILGDVDRKTGLDIPSDIRVTTENFISTMKHEEDSIGYLSVSRYLGYQGLSGNTWNLIVHFYDENKGYIHSVDGYQYRKVRVPNNAKFIKVTLLGVVYPTDLSIHLFRNPLHCSYKNVVIDNSRCVGMALKQMNNFLVEDCEIKRSGQSGAFCGFDAEDGWDGMQDVTYRRLNFHDNYRNDFLTCAGHNFIIDGQLQGNIHIWERTRGLVVKNCNCGSINLGSGGVENIVRHGVYRVYNNVFKEGVVANNLVKNITCKAEGQGLRGRVDNSTLNKLGGASNNYYTNCVIDINSNFLNYLSNQTAINCDFKPVDGFNDRYKLSFNNKEGKFYFENCNFFGKSLMANHNQFHSGHFVDCNFDNTSIQVHVQSKEDDVILFENCKIGYEEENLVRYCPFAYTDGTYSEVVFKDCTIINKSAKSLIYAYSKPVGKVVFENCIIDVPKDTILFDGCDNKDTINIDIEFINTTIVNELKLTHDKFKDNENIRITIK